MVVARATDPYESLFTSKVFQSELVIKEFHKLCQEVIGLSSMASKFPEFDLAGKRMFLERMEDVGSRYEIFMRRLELSEDPGAKEYLRFINAQMMEGGFTMRTMFEGQRVSLAQCQQLCEEEERVIADPEKHRLWQQGLREVWRQSAMGKLDLNHLKNIDPLILNRAQKDPKFYAAIKEISDNPTTATMAKWMDDPAIGPLIAEMWKGMQKGL